MQLWASRIRLVLTCWVVRARSRHAWRTCQQRAHAQLEASHTRAALTGWAEWVRGRHTSRFWQQHTHRQLQVSGARRRARARRAVLRTLGARCVARHATRASLAIAAARWQLRAMREVLRLLRRLDMLSVGRALRRAPMLRAWQPMQRGWQAWRAIVRLAQLQLATELARGGGVRALELSSTYLRLVRCPHWSYLI